MHTSTTSVISLLPKRVLIFVLAAMGLAGPAIAQEATPAAWRVECSGDGKTLDCRAVQQLVAQDSRQLLIQVSARNAPDTKAPTLILQLPLGISLAEPIQIKVDSGKEERFPVQTCTNAGCLLSIPLKDPLLTLMRTGTMLKVTVYDGNKRAINIDVPLLGFGLAFDRATK